MLLQYTAEFLQDLADALKPSCYDFMQSALKTTWKRKERESKRVEKEKGLVILNFYIADFGDNYWTIKKHALYTS